MRTDCDDKLVDIILVITNLSTQPANVSVLDKYKNKITSLVIKAGATTPDRRSLSREFGWYDFVITVDGEPGIQYHIAGHVENGKDSISDPALGLL